MRGGGGRLPLREQPRENRTGEKESSLAERQIPQSRRGHLMKQNADLYLPWSAIVKTTTTRSRHRVSVRARPAALTSIELLDGGCVLFRLAFQDDPHDRAATSLNVPADRAH